MIIPMRLLVMVFLLAVGCERAPIEPFRAEQGEAPDPSTDPLGARLHALGAERTPGHVPEDIGPFRGELRAGQVQSHLAVLQGMRCYVAFAVGGEGVENLDLIVVDENGSPIMRDQDESDVAVIGMRHALCPRVAGSYRLRVSVASGSGEYAVKLYAQNTM